MKKFVTGVILGIFLTAAMFFFVYPDPMFRTKLGRVLDKDVIYFKDGRMLQCWIVGEDEENISVEFDNGHLILPRSRCKEMRKDVLARYIRKLV